jgi:hypothetical protein
MCIFGVQNLLYVVFGKSLHRTEYLIIVCRHLSQISEISVPSFTLVFAFYCSFATSIPFCNCIFPPHWHPLCMLNAYHSFPIFIISSSNFRILAYERVSIISGTGVSFWSETNIGSTCHHPPLSSPLLCICTIHSASAIS